MTDVSLREFLDAMAANMNALTDRDTEILRLRLDLAQCHAALWLALDVVRQGYSDEELEKFAQDVPLDDWGIALVLYATLKATEASDG